MVDPLTGAAALGTALQAAMNITDGLLKGGGSAEFKAQILELQGIIVTSQRQAITAQTAEQALLQGKRELEAEIARMKAWDGEKQRYELKAVGGGAFAYALKDGVEPPEPPHWLCTQCYADRQKSFVLDQGRAPSGPYSIWKCTRCKSGFTLRWGVDPAHP